MEASTTGTFSFLSNRHLASGAVVTLVMGGGQLIFEAASSDVIRYLGGEVYCLIKGGRETSSFETRSAEFYGTVHEDPTCSSYGRIKHIDVRHDLVRDACDAREVGLVCVKSSVRRYTYKSSMSMRRHSSIECEAVRMLEYTVSAVSCLMGKIGSCEAIKN